MFSIATARALVPVLVLTGCSLAGGGASADPFSRPSQPVTILVTNLNFNDATLWAVTRSERIRLGSVTGKTDRSFTVAARGADVWHVEIDLVGGEWCRTRDLAVDPGDVLDLQIALDVSRMPGCYPPGERPGG
jgi:hypothetical protein